MNEGWKNAALRRIRLTPATNPPPQVSIDVADLSLTELGPEGRHDYLIASGGYGRFETFLPPGAIDGRTPYLLEAIPVHGKAGTRIVTPREGVDSGP